MFAVLVLRQRRRLDRFASAVAKGEPHATIDNLIARVNAWWVMVVVLGLAFALGKAGVVVLFGFISFMALREFVSLSYTRRGDHWALAMVFFFFLPVQYVLVGIEWYGLYSILIPVYAFLTLPIFAALSADLTRFFERTSKLQFALMVCVYCISHVPALMTLRIPGFEGGNILLIAWLVLVVQGSDVLQYVWGKLGGRRKIAPELSPSKTVEGFVGGVASATLVGALLAWLTPFAPWQAGAHRARRLPDGILRRPRDVGDEARSRRKGLGHDDRRPRRHARPPRLGHLRGARVLPHRPLLVGTLG